MRKRGPGKSLPRRWPARLAGLAFALALPAAVPAQRLAVTRYTASNGLPSNEVTCIVRDLDGYLWFCTMEGLARFDGYKFQTFGVRHGLASPVVNAFLHARDRTYWVATNKGLCRYRPGLDSRAPVRFDCLAGATELAGRVNALIEDRAGVVWVGTAEGLYRVGQAGGRWHLARVPLDYPAEPYRYESEIRALLEDREGTLWMGTTLGFCRRWPDGQIDRYHFNRTDEIVHSLAQDSDGSLWVGSREGLFLMTGSQDSRKWVVSHVFRHDGLPHPTITSLFRSSDGTFWVGTVLGLSRRVRDDAGGYRFSPLREPAGLPGGDVASVAEDRSGGLWVGFSNNGAVRLAREGAATYTFGGGRPWVRGFYPDPPGGFVAATGPMLLWRFDGADFSPPVAPRTLSTVNTSWGESQIFLRDHLGEWWLPSADGLFRYPAVRRLQDLARTPPKAVYRSTEGGTDSILHTNIILRLFEDSRGDIWIGTASGVSRWQRSSGRLIRLTQADGVPYRLKNSNLLAMAHSFAEDRHGTVWIGFHPQGLARFDGARLTAFTPADGIPDGPILSLLVDHAGRLWVGSSREGLARIDDPAGAVPAVVRYTTGQGLSSNRILCLVEDNQGRIYAGTSRGIDRLDVESGLVRHYDDRDGLPTATAEAAFRDESGALWFGTATAAARLIPDAHPPEPPASPSIREIRVSGSRRTLSELGEPSVAGLALASNENNVQIEYSSLHLDPAERIRYQVRLAESARWSPPTEEQIIRYAKLAAGSYHFEVRAINEDELTSTHSASVSFTIAPPLWLRPWFLAAVALAAAALLYSLYRYRVAYLVALERTRAQLAMDLHDEVGSGLAEIAISCEVARRVAGINGLEHRLAGIADRCRDLRGGMSDVVWAIDPRKDRVSDLLVRIRETAEQLVEPAGSHLEFRATDTSEAASLALAPECKRHILLAVKEALANAARHSGAALVELIVDVDSDRLRVTVRDDGRGFDPAVPPKGNGRRNMAKRSAELRGTFCVDSAPGRGTTVEIAIPLRRNHLLRPWTNA